MIVVVMRPVNIVKVDRDVIVGLVGLLLHVVGNTLYELTTYTIPNFNKSDFELLWIIDRLKQKHFSFSFLDS